MDAEFFIEGVLKPHLEPFIRKVFPDHHRFMQDNDPKHTSRKAKAYYESSIVNWWQTPAESPDLNPIELVWHELKHF
jgi:transposase